LQHFGHVRVAMTGVPEDVPEAHPAHSKVKFSPGAQRCTFKIVVDGQTIEFQTTAKAAGGQEHAERIARLCYVALENGRSVEDVKTYRNGLYEQFGGAPKAKAKPATDEKKRPSLGAEERSVKRLKSDSVDPKPRPPLTLAEAVKQLTEKGRSAGAVKIQGRTSDKKNDSINGVYALLEGGFEGSPAYEKFVDAGTEACDRRFLFYARHKKRWKISQELGDSRGGFAYLLHSGGTGEAPPEKANWNVFDGKGPGYNVDAAVRCVPVNGESTPATAGCSPSRSSGSSDSSDDEDSSVADSPEPPPDASPVTIPNPGQRPLGVAPVTAVPPLNDLSLSPARTGLGTINPGQKPLGTAPVTAGLPPPGGCSPPQSSLEEGSTRTPPVSPSTSRVGTEAVVQRPTSSRVCAKMLVRSGLRCECHYLVLTDCPVRPKQRKRLASQGSG